jgi:hypothetical protein
MQVETFYKVLRVQNRQLISCNPNLPPECQQIYKRNRVNLPAIEGSLIYCFQTLEEATHFLDPYYEWKCQHKFEIWEVQGVNAIRGIKFVYHCDKFLESIQSMWKGSRDVFSGNNKSYTGCEAIVLNKRVKKVN